MAFYNRAFYEKKHFLEPCDNKHFNEVLPPYSTVDCTGIYRCEACGFEIFIRPPQTLPIEAHCDRHAEFGRWAPEDRTGDVRWRLVVTLKNRVWR